MIASGLPNFIRIVCGTFFLILLLRRLMIFFNFQNSIWAHVRHRAFATLQIELYRVVNYNSKWSTKFHKDCILDVFVISLLRRLLNFVRHRAFATLQIELYRVVNYNSKWSIKFHKDCILDVFVISLLRRLLNF